MLTGAARSALLADAAPAGVHVASAVTCEKRGGNVARAVAVNESLSPRAPRGYCGFHVACTNTRVMPWVNLTVAVAVVVFGSLVAARGVESTSMAAPVSGTIWRGAMRQHPARRHPDV